MSAGPDLTNTCREVSGHGFMLLEADSYGLYVYVSLSVDQMREHAGCSLLPRL